MSVITIKRFFFRDSLGSDKRIRISVVCTLVQQTRYMVRRYVVCTLFYIYLLLSIEKKNERRKLSNQSIIRYEIIHLFQYYHDLTIFVYVHGTIVFYME